MFGYSTKFIADDMQKVIVGKWDSWAEDPSNLKDRRRDDTQAMFDFYRYSLENDIKDEILIRSNQQHNSDFAWQRVKDLLRRRERRSATIIEGNWG